MGDREKNNPIESAKATGEGAVEEKERKEAPPIRRISNAPPPITLLSGTGGWTRPTPTQIPSGSEDEAAMMQNHCGVEIEIRERQLSYWTARGLTSHRRFQEAVQRKQLLQREVEVSKLGQAMRISQQQQTGAAAAGGNEPTKVPAAAGASESPLLKLPPMKQDLSKYLDNSGLTDRQRECLSLRYEYGLNKSKIAKRLGLHHETVREYLSRGEVKMNRQGWKRKGAAPDA